MDLITPTNILSSAVLVAVAIIGYFMKDKLNGLAETDKRLEGKIDKIDERVGSLISRVSRIEGSMKLSPFAAGSPVQLTTAGQEILQKSGMKVAIDQKQNELLAEIQKQNPKTAYDVQEVTKKTFQEFHWSEVALKGFKEYSFQSGKWTLADILEVGAVYFRDIALKELGFAIEDLDQK